MGINYDRYTNTETESIKGKIKQGNIKDQKSFDKWAKSNLIQQGSDNRNNIEIAFFEEIICRFYLL